MICSETTSACVVGRIVELEPNSIRISGARRTGVLFSLSEANELSFEDWRDAPPEHAQQLKEFYEAFMFVKLRNCHCEIYAMKTEDEMPSV